MGAGASVNTILGEGADSDTATLPNSPLFAEVVDTFEQLEKIKNKIGEYDAIFLAHELGQLYHKHARIIGRVCCKSKNQLQRARRQYVSYLGAGSDEKRTFLDDVKDQLHGVYGEFMMSLFLTPAEFHITYLDYAMSGLGVDEDLMIDVLCTASQEHIQMIRRACITLQNPAVTLPKFQMKTRRDSPFQKIIFAILAADRDEEGPADLQLAQQQVESIHAIAVSKSRDVDAFLGLIMGISRSQCQAINAEYIKAKNFTLENAISAVLRGSAARAVTMWTYPQRKAMLHALNYALSDSTFHDADSSTRAVSRVLASLDKHEVHKLEADYEAEFGEVIRESFSEFSGNVRLAFESWIVTPPVDGGAEFRTLDYIRLNGNSIYNTFIDGHSIAQMKGLLDEQTAILNGYASTIRTSHEEAMQGLDKMAATNDIAPDEMIKRFGAKKQLSSKCNVPEGEDFTSYSRKHKLVSEYLQKLFRFHDVDHSGALDAMEFWTLIRSVNLGFDADEIEQLKDVADWDKDGIISYFEVSGELADAVMTKMTKMGKNVAAEVSRLLLNPDLDKSELDAQHKFPPSLARYLRSSFDAFDTDKSGYLDVGEFWPFIKSVFTDVIADDELSQLHVRYLIILACSFLA
jgi:Ca2+-binding EF-hand superfamily protein